MGLFFPSTNVLKYLLASSRGSVADYVFMEACDLSIVNAFKIGSLYPLTWTISPCTWVGLTRSQSINKCSKVKEERR